MSKLMNTNRIKKFNWKNQINLKDGLRMVYSDFKAEKINKILKHLNDY